MTDRLTDTIPCSDFQLDAILLKSGSHGDAFHGEACAVEAACVAASCVPELREKYGAAPFADDHPSICRVIRTFVISWNDSLPDDETRTRILKPYVTRILGTKKGPAVAERRAWMAVDWLVRVHAPAFLRLTPSLRPHADALEALGEITGIAAARLADPVLRVARAATRAAARAAAGDAAWDAARDAAWDAARAATRAAARDAAGDAAWDAAWAAARAAAWAAARDAARDAAWDAARAAARAAAWDALAPTVLALQESACDLLDRMIAEGKG